MKEEIAKKWAKALRSGQYVRGEGALRSEQRGDQPPQFCCLGVLCNLHAQAHPRIAAKERDPTRYMGAHGYLPEQVRKWAGLQTKDGRFSTGIDSLARVNDAGIQFNEIAGMIERRFKEL